MHFTYVDEPDKKSLKQGDVLRKTDQLMALLREVHPLYTDNSYTHFQVLTQSCDLVRRNGRKCKSRYITLAAVRSLDLVLTRAIEEVATKKVMVGSDLYCSEEHKRALSSKIVSLFNNNDKTLFFLKAQPTHDLFDDSCTFLLLSIPLRAYQHYDLCLNAKILELTDTFQAKLGWLVGNLYSRVGTEDYVPGALPDQDSFTTLIRDTLNNYVRWVPDSIFSEFQKNAKHLNSSEEIIDKIEETKASNRQRRLHRLVGLINRAAQLTDQQQTQVINMLAADTFVQKLLD